MQLQHASAAGSSLPAWECNPSAIVDPGRVDRKGRPSRSAACLTSEQLHSAADAERERHIEIPGVCHKAFPVQKPHPPLWLGGNAQAVRERVAQWGQGWAPRQGNPQLSRNARTSEISSQDERARLVREIRARMEDLGRDPAELDVLAGTTGRGCESVDENLDAIGSLGGMVAPGLNSRSPVRICQPRSTASGSMARTQSPRHVLCKY
jgi:alkanesulfonate monooxygenase SsuD/methylene tetrahydromethanopterin reductase-like flavin-dependent oxidoreductase (luciferase family)